MFQDDSFKDLTAYFGSTASTLRAQGQRVRNLIGENHWQSDGTYKERLIKNTIREIVPSSLKVGDGFLVYKKDRNEDGFEASRQLDVIVYDDRYVAPLFRDGDFVIILAETAISAIEVKSNWGNSYSQIEDGVEKIQSAHQLYRKVKNKAHTRRAPDLFTACIAFGGKPNSTDKKADANFAFEKIAKSIKQKFQQALFQQDDIEPELQLRDLDIIEHRYLVKSLCPQMILSLEENWIITPGEIGSVDLNKWDNKCPVVNQKSTIGKNRNNKEINLSLHLFLATLRSRCIEWLNQDKHRPDRSIHKHLLSFLHKESYQNLNDPIALVPHIDGVENIFPEVKFLR